ncbi:MAG: ribosomal protein S18-alanine N-acetyltransferase [Gammaproteobacteria bacterium]|nr:ribosomal protein S18-alanine N-acetyltransferase [Gammaproteobacteria bacterium]MDH5650942.1 ribosomal protein S18-alanine N-acetyltransferase [Gammaproteobacteria bacterium]
MSAVLEPGISLRPMTIDDLDQVIAIETATYDFPWTRGIFHDCLQVGYCCWVIETAGDIFAYGVMSVAADEAHILTIVVSEDARRQGFGKSILEHLLNIAQQRNASVVLLEVRPSNTAAVNLYYQTGFSEIGIRKDYYPDHGGREDALVMGLDIDYYSGRKF